MTIIVDIYLLFLNYRPDTSQKSLWYSESIIFATRVNYKYYDLKVILIIINQLHSK